MTTTKAPRRVRASCRNDLDCCWSGTVGVREDGSLRPCPWCKGRVVSNRYLRMMRREREAVTIGDYL